MNYWLFGLGLRRLTKGFDSQTLTGNNPYIIGSPRLVLKTQSSCINPHYRHYSQKTLIFFMFGKGDGDLFVCPIHLFIILQPF